jgi:twitching motility protein PilJ
MRATISSWSGLLKGDKATGLPPRPARAPKMDAVQQDWENLRKNTDAILASEQTVLSLHQVAATLAETVPQLQVEYEKVVEILCSGGPASQVAVAQRQSLLAERILGSVNTVLAGDDNSVQAADASAATPAVRPGAQGHARRQPGDEHHQVEDRRCPRRLAKFPSCSSSFRLGGRNPRNLARTVPGARIGGNIFTCSQTLLDKASHLADGFENLAAGRT